VSRKIIDGAIATIADSLRATTASYRAANAVSWRVSRRTIGGATVTTVVSPRATTATYRGVNADNWRGINGTIGATGKAVIAAEVAPRSRGIFPAASAGNWPATFATIAATRVRTVVNLPAATVIYHAANVVN
jgi:hypothetical protein